MKLWEMAANAQSGDKEALLEIIEKFTPLIKKYKRRLNYDGADTDLIICLIETVYKIPINENPSMLRDECIIGYISTAIKNRYIYLSKRHFAIYKIEVQLNPDIAGEDSTSEMVESIAVRQLLDNLPKRQRIVIKGIFYDDYTEAEIAKELNISRQGVNKAKRKALKKLRKHLCSMF